MSVTFALAKLRPGNVHSADDWEELLLPEIGRGQERGKELVIRADAAFAKPEIYEALEDRWQGPVSGPWSSTRAFPTRPRVGRRPAGWRPKEHHQGELFPRVGFIVTNLQWIKEGKQAVKMAAAGVAEEDRELVADPACSSCW